VTIPEVILPALKWHIRITGPDADSLVFTDSNGGPLRHSNFRGRVWLPALKESELTGVHFHDLRHTGNMLAADAGASVRELMDRMGHDSQRAAMIYLHGGEARQREIADKLSRRAREELKPSSRRRSGAQRARNRSRAS
jgi:integrase